jgi:hypothetical protein
MFYLICQFYFLVFDVDKTSERHEDGTCYWNMLPMNFI